MTSWRLVISLMTSWCIASCQEPTSAQTPPSPPSQAADTALETLQTQVESACNCSGRSCLEHVLEGVERHVTTYAKTALSVSQRGRVDALVKRLRTCTAQVRDDEDRLRPLKEAIKRRCACKPADGACVSKSDERVTEALEATKESALKTHEQIVRRSLQFEVIACRSRDLSKPADPPPSSPTRGQLADWQDLPRNIGASKHLQQMAMRLGISRIDALWGRSPEDIARAFPRAENGEFNDLEPWGRRLRLRLGNIDRRGVNLVLEWRFMGGRLFMVVVEMKRTSQAVPKLLEKWMKRPPDTVHTEDWRMKVRTWFDADLAIRATIDGKAKDFALAHLPSLMTYLERRRTGQKALALNRKGLRYLRTRPFSRGYTKATQLLEEALAVVPGYGHARVNLCRALLFQGRTADAIAHCRLAARSKNRSASAESVFYLGMAASAKRDYAAAEKLFKTAAGREANDRSIETGASRWLRFLNRKPTDKDLNYVTKEIACAQADKDAPRAMLLATNAGFESPQAFNERAARKGDRAKYTTWAARRCGPKP